MSIKIEDHWFDVHGVRHNRQRNDVDKIIALRAHIGDLLQVLAQHGANVHAVPSPNELSWMIYLWHQGQQVSVQIFESSVYLRTPEVEVERMIELLQEIRRQKRISDSIPREDER